MYLFSDFWPTAKKDLSPGNIWTTNLIFAARISARSDPALADYKQAEQQDGRAEGHGAGRQGRGGGLEHGHGRGGRGEPAAVGAGASESPRKGRPI